MSNRLKVFIKIFLNSYILFNSPTMNLFEHLQKPINFAALKYMNLESHFSDCTFKSFGSSWVFLKNI